MTTKNYLRFSQNSVFGVIASSTARILQLNHDKRFNSIAVPACENVILWNLQTKEKTQVFNGELSYVTCLICDVNAKNIAVGYADGFIRIFDFRTGNCVVSFCGHKSAVSCLTYDEDSLNLASGGKDSEIVVWNITDQAGLFRLKGHKGPVTKCHFFKPRNVLISSSRDTYIKFWDLDTQHCFQTLVESRYEVMDFVIIKDSRLITGVNDSGLRVWDLFLNENDTDFSASIKRLRLDTEAEGEDESIQVDENRQENDDKDELFKYADRGNIMTLGDKTVCMVVDNTERILGCHASTKILQLYMILNSEETYKKFRRRKKNENKKRANRDEDDSMASEITLSLLDEFLSLPPIQTKGTIDSFSIVVSNGDIAKIAVLLKNNSIFQYELNIKNKDSCAELCHNIILPGHRNIVRSLNYSRDCLSLLSVSDKSAKVWKRFQEQQVCTQTLSCDFGLCSVFVSGGSHCIVGTKHGTLEIFEINSQELVEKVQSHNGSVNCLCESPGQCGVTSGSKDKSVKFWNFELLHDESYSQTKKKLSLSLNRTLQMPDEVLCLRYSPDKMKIAVALLDNTVQVLFVDSLKLVFSLYGHVLPVTCMDISYDSTLIVTGSEDKDIRIWSMEFGNCNKFIKKAHDKGITCLYFLPKTHMFFTGGRDNVIKQWDADNFQKITTLKGHQSEVCAMAVSPDGLTVMTASKDKSIRMWEKTTEPLVLQEEQEKEAEEENEVEDLPVVPGEVNKEVALPGIKTMETINTADQLIEGIDIYKQEVLKLQDHKLECKSAGKELPPPAPHPLLIAYRCSSPIRYIRKVINKIKSSELEGTLLYLPFNYVYDFLKILCEFLERGWETELSERCSSFLVRIHMGQILASQHFQPVIEKLKEKMFNQVYHTRDMIGFVKTACQLQQRAIDALEEVPMFTSVLDGLQEKKRKSKKKLKRSIVTFT